VLVIVYDVFEVAESESEVRLALRILVLPILAFVDFDCPRLYVPEAWTLCPDENFAQAQGYLENRKRLP